MGGIGVLHPKVQHLRHIFQEPQAEVNFSYSLFHYHLSLITPSTSCSALPFVVPVFLVPLPVLLLLPLKIMLLELLADHWLNKYLHTHISSIFLIDPTSNLLQLVDLENFRHDRNCANASPAIYFTIIRTR
ncbi:MAG: hypothetical protein EXX96DRAFT_621724 [Benjaminiella poitrasii]|nr:MAG: hypothetical protein EXX96DRAFT_621724 [Benjaminiella poitrasii]